MIQDVFIIGATGKVGKTLVGQIYKKGDTNSKIHPNPTRVVGLASHNTFIYSIEGISEDKALNFVNRQYPNAQTYSQLNDLLNAVKYGTRNKESMLTFVDVTALNEPMIEFHLHVIKDTPYNIVTANKNPVALSDYETFQQLTHSANRYGYRCSVMAGAEAVQFLQDLRDVNDPIHKMEGCLSGTNAYITSELEKGKKFSEILRYANTEGYTEPHPRDDLNGMDVAKKLVTLARTAGYPMSINDVKLEPMIPEKYFKEDDVEKFLDGISALDNEFEQRMNAAKKAGNKLRYVAKLDLSEGTPKLEVSLIEVKKESQLGTLKGALNRLVIYTDTYPNGRLIEAEGAGLTLTAQNARVDLAGLISKRKNRIFAK